AGRLEEGLDLHLLLVEQLSAVVEELHAVVLGRVVRRGDDDAEVLGQERNRGSRQNTREHGRAVCRNDSPCHRLLELGSRTASIAADQNAPATCPEGRGLADPLDEVRRELCAHHAAHPIGPEVPPHGGRTYLFENCGALRALCRPAFLRSTM